MQWPNVICLAIDRLHVGYLGAYGNTWASTSTIDRLASDSLVVDRGIIDSPQLEIAYRSLWLGLHAACPCELETNKAPLPVIFADRGWHTALLTDETEVAKHPLAAAFVERVFIEPHSKAGGDTLNRQVADSVDQTDAAGIFGEAVRWLKKAESPIFLWLHTGTLGRVWDAPLEFRQQFVDEDDPESSVEAELPHLLLPEDFDPDKLLAFSHAYAGQVSLIDQLLESLLDAIDTRNSAEDTILVLFSPRGISLGEHRRVGVFDGKPHAEVIHVPLMIRSAASMGRGFRSQHLVQPADLYSTILDCCELSDGYALNDHAGRAVAKLKIPGHSRSMVPLMKGAPTATFDRACCVAPTQTAFITPAWALHVSNNYLKGSAATTAEHSSVVTENAAELFAKPDDWLEINEVSDRCPEIVEKMRGAMLEFIDACQRGEPALLSPLPCELITGLD